MNCKLHVDDMAQWEMSGRVSGEEGQLPKRGERMERRWGIPSSSVPFSLTLDVLKEVLNLNLCSTLDGDLGSYRCM